MLTANLQPLEKLNFSLSGAYTYSKGGLDTITFENINGQLGFDPATSGMALYDYDFTKVNTYSDLNIKQWDVSLGGTYQLTSRFSLSAGINYMDYDEDETYLADESGSAYIAMLNLTYWFK
jgi:long-subunit fatty acid transport protein